MRLKYNNKGFTLIELLAYIAIFSAVIMSIFSFFFLVLKAKASDQVNSEVEMQATQAMQVILQTIRLSTAVTSPVTGNNDATLSLNGGTTTFSLSSGKIVMTEGTTTTDLTSSRVNVTNFIFYNNSSGGIKPSIRVQFTVGYDPVWTKGEYQYQKTYDGAASIR